MSNPYEPPAAGFGGPVPGPEKTRPTSITVFGILNIVFAALGLICTPIGLVYNTMAAPPPVQGQPNPMLDILKDPVYRNGTLAFGVVGMVASAVLLAAGIGLLKGKSWGRTLSIGYAVYALIALVASTFFQWTYVIQPLMADVNQLGGDPAMAGAMKGGAIGGVVGGLCGGSIYPILLLIFMNRPNVKQALQPADPFESGPATF